MGTRELARTLGYPPTATHRLLATLERHGFARQDPESDKYVLGARVLELTALFLKRFDFRHVALPVMREIHDRCDETVGLFVLDGLERVCVESLESGQSLRRVVPIGTRLPLHVGATGKLFLAYMSPDRLERSLAGRLERFTEHTITDVAQLCGELETIRSEGCARSMGERVDGAGSVAAPVWGATDTEPLAVLAVSAPVMRFGPDRQLVLLDLVREGADRISRKLGAANGYPGNSNP